MGNEDECCLAGGLKTGLNYYFSISS
eukprot:COSAG01_NODE_69622_length_261_cov_0.382716_2_plen_25_part_01